MRLRVVVLEDDSGLRRLLAMLVEFMGHEVLAFPDPSVCPIYNGNGCECPNDKPCGDVLLTDNRMPNMSGLEFIQHQVDAGCKGIVANKAVLSSTLNDEEEALARSLGCRIFKKPFHVGELQRWIGECEKTLARKRDCSSFH